MASIAKRPDGRWRARYRDADGKEYARHFQTKRDGQAWLDDVTAAVRSNTYVDPRYSRGTMAEYYPDWADRQLWALSTRASVDLAVKLCTFSTVPFGKLKRSHAESWVKSMESTLAASTVQTRVKNVRLVLRAAIRDRVLASDPLDGVPLPRQRRAEHAMRIPTPAEVAALVNAAPEPWYRLYLEVCAFAGARQMEAPAVQLSDFNFLGRSLHIERQVIRASGPVVRTTPPKHGSERTVPVPDELLVHVNGHIRTSGTVGDKAWLFRGSGNQPPKRTRLAELWNGTARRAGVEGITQHSLRHFFASGLIADGRDPVTVQRAMGHADASITLRIYSHLWPDAEDKTRQSVANLMTAVFGSADRLRTDSAESRA